MSDVNALGPQMPTGPIQRTGRTSPAAPAARSAEAEGGFGSDAVSLSGASEAPPTPSAKPEVKHEKMLVVDDGRTLVGSRNFDPSGGWTVAEVDGFLVAGSTPSPTGAPPAGGTSSTLPSGPIAMIDEPRAAVETEFPGLSLNGPGSAFDGLWGLSGERLA